MTVTRPEIPLRAEVITVADVRASISRAKRSLERAAEEIVWQIETEAWRTLKYSSWGAMREAEYGGAAFMVPNKNRPELVARMDRHLTQGEIAATAGVSTSTVERDLASNPHLRDSGDEPHTITNSRGQRRPATYSRTETDDVVDAEIVEDDEPVHVNTQTGEVLDTPDATTDPTPVGSAVTTTTCPTCHGTGKVTQ